MLGDHDRSVVFPRWDKGMPLGFTYVGEEGHMLLVGEPEQAESHIDQPGGLFIDVFAGGSNLDSPTYGGQSKHDPSFRCRVKSARVSGGDLPPWRLTSIGKCR